MYQVSQQVGATGGTVKYRKLDVLYVPAGTTMVGTLTGHDWSSSTARPIKKSGLSAIIDIEDYNLRDKSAANYDDFVFYKIMTENDYASGGWVSQTQVRLATSADTAAGLNAPREGAPGEAVTPDNPPPPITNIPVKTDEVGVSWVPIILTLGLVGGTFYLVRSGKLQKLMKRRPKRTAGFAN